MFCTVFAAYTIIAYGFSQPVTRCLSQTQYNRVYKTLIKGDGCPGKKCIQITGLSTMTPDNAGKIPAYKGDPLSPWPKK